MTRLLRTVSNLSEAQIKTQHRNNPFAAVFSRDFRHFLYVFCPLAYILLVSFLYFVLLRLYLILFCVFIWLMYSLTSVIVF